MNNVDSNCFLRNQANQWHRNNPLTSGNVMTAPKILLNVFVAKRKVLYLCFLKRGNQRLQAAAIFKMMFHHMLPRKVSLELMMMMNKLEKIKPIKYLTNISR
jgi:hypothetical protein